MKHPNAGLHLFCSLSCACLLSIVLAGCSAQDEQSGQLCPFLPNGKPIAEGSALYPDPLESTKEADSQAKAALGADGIYTGKAQGMCGAIEVTIEIKDSHLTVKSISQEGETQGVGGYEAIVDGTYAKLIEKAQGAQFDAVSGATLTSLAVQEAVQEAIDASNKAKG